MNSETKICKNCKQEFQIEPEDFAFYEKIKVPPPTFCPECRRQRRFAWRNDFTLYSRACNFCKRPIVSLYSPQTSMKIFCNKCWWSDSWDARDYGRDFDFSRPFFEQFRELQNEVPALALINDNEIASVNCEYTQDFAFGKNCYMTFVSWRLEDCLYGCYLGGGKYMVDTMNSDNSELIYNSICADGSYNCRNVYYVYSLRDSYFCYDCRDSSNCFLSAGLRHKQYCIKNKQYTKEEYEKILASYRLDTYSGVRYAEEEFRDILLRYPHRFANMKNCVNCVGEDLSSCKEIYHGFNMINSENCKYLENSTATKDSYDLTVSGEAAQCYESLTPDQSYGALFTIFSWKNVDVAYTENCHSSQYLFGCSGLKKKEYHILNKPYPKEKYFALKGKIISHMRETGEWGEFFPARLSHFGYNETMAQLSCQLSKEEALERCFRWEDNIQVTTDRVSTKTEDIPDSIRDIESKAVEETFSCVRCKRNFIIISQELSFYKKMSIPFPRECFYCRNLARIKLRNPQKLWSRVCDCGGRTSRNGVHKNQAEHVHRNAACSNEFKTTYAPDRPEIVYCEVCYQAEVQ